MQIILLFQPRNRTSGQHYLWYHPLEGDKEIPIDYQIILLRPSERRPLGRSAIEAATLACVLLLDGRVGAATGTVVKTSNPPYMFSPIDSMDSYGQIRQELTKRILLGQKCRVSYLF
jgi:hypothetical protein